MARTALLIGSDYKGLRGVAHDLTTMNEALAHRGFTVRECPPALATRAGILAAYEDLIADTRPDDAVVVYYSGHGGFTEPSGVAAHGPWELQYIVPIDFGQSSADDFRGVASVELSVLQNRLTDITPNVTVILDCCHSGLMSRDPNVTLKAVRPVTYEWVRVHIDRLQRQGLNVRSVRAEGNRKAVRIVACAPDQRAYEYTGKKGKRTGILTESLTIALAEAGNEPVSWATVVDRVRHRVVGLGFGQRPEVEGPANRLLFTTEEVDLLHSLPAVLLNGRDRVRLDCAPLLRVQDGDEFMLMPPGAPRADFGTRIGDLTVDTVSAMSAMGDVIFAPGQSAMPLGARAFPTKVAVPQIAVKVPAGDPRISKILDVFPALARPVTTDDEDWSGEVRFTPDGRLELHDRTGPLHPPYPCDPAGAEDLMAAVKIFAQATQLRRLVGDPSYPLDADIEIEWGLVNDGSGQRLATEGEVLRPGQRVYVTVRNGGEVPIYVSFVDIGVSGRISLIYRATPSGRLLPKYRTLTLGWNDTTGTLAGVDLEWPVNLDPARARPETILVVLTSAPQSLLALEQPEITQTRQADRGVGGSPLQNVIDQLATGGSRDLGSDWSSGVRYDIHGIDFAMTLDPPITAD